MQQRHLPAIEFTDIVLYNSLMGKGRDLTLELLCKNCNLQRPLIKTYCGEWLKEMDYGILIVFDAASNAVCYTHEISKISIEDLELIHAKEEYHIWFEKYDKD